MKNTLNLVFENINSLFSHNLVVESTSSSCFITINNLKLVNEIKKWAIYQFRDFRFKKRGKRRNFVHNLTQSVHKSRLKKAIFYSSYKFWCLSFCLSILDTRYTIFTSQKNFSQLIFSIEFWIPMILVGIQHTDIFSYLQNIHVNTSYKLIFVNIITCAHTTNSQRKSDGIFFVLKSM